MRPGPGTFLWLVANDLRLEWRGFAGLLGGASPRAVVLVVIAGGILLHLLAWPAVAWLSPALHGAEATVAPLAAVLGGAFTWMIAQSVFGATRTLYDRGDLDLLLSSPLPAEQMIAAKAVAIAASTLGSIALLVLPLANIGALIEGPAWLGIYPTLMAMALIATALGLGLLIALFWLVGPRRARTTAQMTAAGIGGAFVLGAQIVAMLPGPLRLAVTDWVDGAARSDTMGASALLRLPLEAVRGDALAMAILLGTGVVLFWVAVTMLGERFANASLLAAGAQAEASHGKRSRLAFRAGRGRNLRLKEWRLLVRDPSLFAQLGLQIIYTIPLAVVLLRSELLPTALALGPTIVMIAAQVAGSIAWITVSGEDAPELIATAPVTAASADRAKLSAVALPVLAILALPLAGLAFVSWRAALVVVVFAAMAGASTALLNFWHPMPGNRRGMLRRHSQSKLIGLVEHGLAMLWVFAVVFALLGSVLALAPIAIVTGILAFCRSRSGGRAEVGVALAPGAAGLPLSLGRQAAS